MKREFDRVQNTNQVDVQGIQSGLFGIFCFDWRFTMVSSRLVCCSVNSLSVEKTGSMPPMPAFATTISILPDGEDAIAVLKTASCSAHTVTSHLLNWVALIALLKTSEAQAPDNLPAQLV